MAYAMRVLHEYLRHMAEIDKEATREATAHVSASIRESHDGVRGDSQCLYQLNAASVATSTNGLQRNSQTYG